MEHNMTTPENKEIPPQTTAGEAEKSGQPLSDASLEQLTGGASGPDEWPDCCAEDDGVDLDMVEGSIRLKPGSDIPVVDK
jgi:hypothetical protein